MSWNKWNSKLSSPRTTELPLTRCFFVERVLRHIQFMNCDPGFSGIVLGASLNWVHFLLIFLFLGDSLLNWAHTYGLSLGMLPKNVFECIFGQDFRQRFLQFDQVFRTTKSGVGADCTPFPFWWLVHCLCYCEL